MISFSITKSRMSSKHVPETVSHTIQNEQHTMTDRQTDTRTHTLRKHYHPVYEGGINN